VYSKVILSIAILAISLVFLNVVDAGSENKNHYCYDQDMEGYVCFDRLKECEKEQGNDLMALGPCTEEERE
jgi:hypothetical protein